ncbi:Ras-related protein [Medicago truncatula]|uniref:Ras-related protein n=1 Tax=Medicago truncatula TaxID=3880 RepID=G7K6Z0_MEDTR|nr:Ras-related protein [Medicago truncatula]
MHTSCSVELVEQVAQLFQVFTGLGRGKRVRLATIDAGFVPRELQINDSLVTLQIWDTERREGFQIDDAIAFYKEVDCCVLVYDVNFMESFDMIDNLDNKFLANFCEKLPVPVINYMIMIP